LLILFTFAGFIETVFFGALNAFTPLYLPRLGVIAEKVPVWTGGLVAASSAIGIPFLPFWGALADRYSRKPIIVRSFFVHLLAVLGMLVARNIWVFAIGRSLTSLALGNSGLMMTTLTENAPRRRQGLAFSIMNGAPPVGAFLGPMISGALVDTWGFPALLGMIALLMLAVILALSFGYRDSYVGKNREPLLGMAVDSLRLIGQSARLRALFPALFLLFAGWTIAITYTPLAITTLYTGDQPGTAVGIVLGAGGLTTLLLSPLVGLLADRFGHWRVLFAGAGIAVILWPIPYFTSDLFSFSIAWALTNGLVSSIFAISFAVLSASATSQVRGRVMSYAYLPMNVGFLVGPAIGSLITRISIFAVYPVAAILTAAGIGVLWVARRQSISANNRV